MDCRRAEAEVPKRTTKGRAPAARRADPLPLVAEQVGRPAEARSCRSALGLSERGGGSRRDAAKTVYAHRRGPTGLADGFAGKPVDSWPPRLGIGRAIPPWTSRRRRSVCGRLPGSVKLSRSMATIRRHLRTWATAWLVVQAGWVSALVPRDCCAAHQPATVHANESCHESAAAAHCPMPSADGTPCPKHRPSEPREHHQSSTNECAWRGTCEGPMAALFALLSNHGILPEAAAAIPKIGAVSSSLPVRESIVSRRDSPDPPPPRA
jgi:hypothetical protein